MSARVVNVNQLAMFMPAHELAKMHSLDKYAFESTSRMRSDKRKMNRMSGMKQSIMAEGIKDPVLIAHGRDPAWNTEMGEHAIAVANGNHRVTAAMDIDPNMEVPVAHYDKVDPLFEEMHRQGSWAY